MYTNCDDRAIMQAPVREPKLNKSMSYIFRTPRGKSTILHLELGISYESFLRALLEKSAAIDRGEELGRGSGSGPGSGIFRSNINGMGNRRKIDTYHGRMVRRRLDDVVTCTFANDDCGPMMEMADHDNHLEIETREEEKNGVDINREDLYLSQIAYIVHNGKVLDKREYLHFITTHSSSTDMSNQLHHISLNLRLRGGIDRQNRVGSKFGGGGVSSAQHSERERKERLRQLALETVDLAKDPYLMRNHLGTYECKLCLTLHTNEGNYLAHTQGKKHQAGLAKRAHMESLLKGRNEVGPSLPTSSTTTKAITRVKIGRPGYEISKSRHHETNQRCLSFQLHFPEIDSNLQPRHRFMSAYEQRVESPPDRRYQYLIIAAEPYETVSFKIPNEKIDRTEGMFVTNWDADEKRFTLTFYFVDPSK